MKLLANENFHLSSVKLFKQSGFDILYVGNDFTGYLDSEVMELANKESRTILTFDRDYGELIFKQAYRPTSGVIYLRWESFQPIEPAEFLIKLFESNKLTFKNMLTVISKNHIRQRKFQ